MRSYFLKTLQNALFTWIILEVGIIATSVLYATLIVVGISENNSLLAAFLTLIGLILLGLLLAPKPFLNLRQRNEAATLKSTQKAYLVTRFVIVQFITLVGWILEQSFFSLSPLGRTIPFALITVIEAIWWIATMSIMLLLFMREYTRFVQSAVELEEANRKLREETNQILARLRDQSTQAESGQTP